jgi:glutathione synthase/RimK-type ligase-like ATP-grasp enzyme
MTVLFVSDPEADGHLLPVLTELSRRGHEVQIFNPGAFPDSATVTVDSTPCGPRTLISWGQEEVDLATVGSVWYRRPGNFELPEELISKEAEWLRGECVALINGIYANTEALWVSDPFSQRRADLKLLQLRIAQKLGFRVPAYTVTNDPRRARSFLAEHSSGVIVKALSMPAIQLEDRAGMIYTHLVTAEDEEQLESVRYGPTFLQAFVPKARDIRVTVIGEELFAAGIESMTAAEGRIDFRKAEVWDLPHEAVTLPEPVAAACLAIVSEVGLRFGAIDLIETTDGGYVFLEINPNGQWYWVEMMTGQPMARAMADLLERGEREHGHHPDTTRAFTLAEPTSHVLAVGEQTAPYSSKAAATGNGDGPMALTNLTATRPWFQQKHGELLLHVGDVEAVQ